MLWGIITIYIYGCYFIYTVLIKWLVACNVVIALILTKLSFHVNFVNIFTVWKFVSWMIMWCLDILGT